MNLGETIEDFRMKARITKGTMAKRAEISGEGYRLIIRNDRVPTPETIEKIITAANIPEDDAVRLREEAMICRAVKAGFDPHQAAERMWVYFRNALLDELREAGVVDHVNMDYVREEFMVAADEFLIPYTD